MYINNCYFPTEELQEPITRSVQLPTTHIPVKAISQTDLFLGRKLSDQSQAQFLTDVIV